MPDEYGLPTAEEYAAEQRRLDEEERRAQLRADVSRGAEYGGYAGSALGALGLGPIGTIGGTIIGGAVGLGRSALRNIITDEDMAEKRRQLRLAGLLRRAELGELVDPEEMAAIERQYMDPYLANQRAQQQRALQQVAAQDMGAGSFARAQQARAAAQAEEMLEMADLIENQRREQEEAERKELAALVAGDIEAAQKAAEQAGEDAQTAFQSFIESTTQLADPEWEKQFQDALGLNEGATSAENETAMGDVADFTGRARDLVSQIGRGGYSAEAASIQDAGGYRFLPSSMRD